MMYSSLFQLHAWALNSMQYHISTALSVKSKKVDAPL
jgi:hypothetical protein